MLVLLLLALVCLGALLPLARVRPDTAPAAWYQLASYQHGSVSHLVPMRDELVHTEDEVGDCPCLPRPGAYPLGDGRTGTLFLHRPHAHRHRDR